VTVDTRLVNAGTALECADVDGGVELEVEGAIVVAVVVLDGATGADCGVADDAHAPHDTDRARSATHRGSRRRTHS
jgi:hypothetical protein